jgi:hypothetical protein
MAASGVTLSRESAYREARPPVAEPLLFRVLASDRLLAAPARHRYPYCRGGHSFFRACR